MVNIYRSVHTYPSPSRQSNSVDHISIKFGLELFTADLIIYDDRFRAVGIYYDLRHQRTGHGPDIVFSITDFSEILNGLLHRDLLPPLIQDDQLTSNLFGLNRVPKDSYDVFVRHYIKLKILVKDGRGRLKKPHG